MKDILTAVQCDKVILSRALCWNSGKAQVKGYSHRLGAPQSMCVGTRGGREVATQDFQVANVGGMIQLEKSPCCNPYLIDAEIVTGCESFVGRGQETEEVTVPERPCTLKRKPS